MPQVLAEASVTDINLALHFLVTSSSCSRAAGDAAPLVPVQGASGQPLRHEGSGGGSRPHFSVSPEGIRKQSDTSLSRSVAPFQSPPNLSAQLLPSCTPQWVKELPLVVLKDMWWRILPTNGAALIATAATERSRNYSAR